MLLPLSSMWISRLLKNVYLRRYPPCLKIEEDQKIDSIFGTRSMKLISISCALFLFSPLE
jgi:hypothetical protein